jgi:diaminohydroxyphosphoribosylaminopyrimidine deaminase/5-amino-6-(5-phosphoribosylamino)uracil reductase
MHDACMRQALRLAAQQTGATGSNPAVGCVIAKDGQVIATGVTAASGRPHAETQALALAGDAARGATLYVTLEPCCHHGGTPPCTDAIIAAGISHVVCALSDPDPRVNGNGIKRLREAGITVTENICRDEAAAQLEGFIRHRLEQRPFISMKLATTLDGFIANARGESQWITGESARRFGHLLRSRHDAILTGINTVLADDPLLSSRLAGHRSPLRIVCDAQLRLPLTSQLVKTARDIPLLVVTTGNDTQALEEAGAEILRHDPHDLPGLMRALAERGITRLLVEAGAQLSTSFLQSELVDELYWMQAPIWFGAEGKAALNALPAIAPSDLTRAKRLGTLHFADDICHHLRVTEAPCLPAS